MFYDLIGSTHYDGPLFFIRTVVSQFVERLLSKFLVFFINVFCTNKT